MARSYPGVPLRIGSACAVALVSSCLAAADPSQPELASRVVTLLRVDGALLKDLNKNGTLERLRGLAPPGRRAGQGPRLLHDPRGEGWAHGRPLAPDGPGRNAERAGRLRRESIQWRTRGTRVAGDGQAPVRAAVLDGRRPRPARGRPARLEGPAVRDRLLRPDLRQRRQLDRGRSGRRASCVSRRSWNCF